MPSVPTFAVPRAAALYQRLIDRTARTGVVGLGYVGLPLAAAFGQAGFTVIGVDVDEQKCDAVNRGESHVSYVESEALKALVKAGKLSAVVDSALGGIEPLDTISICVPTPLRETKDPDLSYVLAAAHAVKGHLRPGMLIVLESTTFPGTTDEVLRSVLEETGLVAGTDFFLAYSPERVDPGLPDSVLRPRVVGGLTPDCSALAIALYESIVDQVVRVSSPRAAEMTKLLENTFRAVNIGLINEMALMCESLQIDVWEVIEAAATKPAGFMPFYPGPGLGGHCIPVDPFYLSWKVREFGLEARFIELAGYINGSMPHHVVDKISEALNSQMKAINGSDILLMGVAYKADVDDVREAPALDVIAELLRRGASVAIHDPFVPRVHIWTASADVVMESVPCTAERLGAADCVVVLTNHTPFDYAEVVSSAQLVVDTCNAIKAPSPTTFKLGSPNPQSSLTSEGPPCLARVDATNG